MYEQIYAWDNLYLAFRRAAKGKRGQPPAAAFEYRLEENLLQLQHALETQTYQPGAYTSFYIHEPKRRLISAAPFRDRVVHHALCQLIEPLFEQSFIFDSYANRVGKGTHRALDRAQHFARHYRYVLQCDIRQYFPSIDHARLREILARKIHDARVMWLIDQILESGRGVLAEEYAMVYFPGDDLFAATRPRGLPIGNLTSQFWANCYLNPIDHFIKRELQCPGYVRYVDDLLLFGEDKQVLGQWRAELIQRLARLRVTLHETRAQVRPTRTGIPFLGFILLPTKRRLKRANVRAFVTRLRRQIQLYHQQQLDLAAITRSTQAWLAHAAHGDTRHLCTRLLRQNGFT
ncbi:MAG: RNA-dependent DNA polymerase [Chloroflexi bacterium]|nr:RNA-dependent DNA polymerase [Chloroflexota bacterium]